MIQNTDSTRVGARAHSGLGVQARPSSECMSQSEAHCDRRWFVCITTIDWLRFYVPPDTKLVISETFSPANLGYVLKS